MEEINFQICKVIFCLSLGDICREQIEVIFSLCWESIFLKPDSSAFLLAGARTSDGRQFCFSLPPSTSQIYSKKIHLPEKQQENPPPRYTARKFTSQKNSKKIHLPDIQQENAKNTKWCQGSLQFAAFVSFAFSSALLPHIMC